MTCTKGVGPKWAGTHSSSGIRNFSSTVLAQCMECSSPAPGHPRGRALRTVADELLRHLDATPLFEEWLGTWKRATAASAASSVHTVVASKAVAAISAFSRALASSPS